MKLAQLFITSLVFLSCPLLANTLKVGDELVITHHNGEEVSSGFFSSARSVELTPGNQNIILVYEDVFESASSDDHDVIKSSPFAINFSAKAGESYRVVMEIPIDEDAAKKFARKPIVKVVNEQNDEVALMAKYLPNEEDEAIKSLSMKPNSNKTVMLVAPATIKKPIVNQHQSRPASIPPAPKVYSDPDSLNMLLYWWQRATPEQKRVFKEAISN